MVDERVKSRLQQVRVLRCRRRTLPPCRSSSCNVWPPDSWLYTATTQHRTLVSLPSLVGTYANVRTNTPSLHYYHREQPICGRTRSTMGNDVRAVINNNNNNNNDNNNDKTTKTQAKLRVTTVILVNNSTTKRTNNNIQAKCARDVRCVCVRVYCWCTYVYYVMCVFILYPLSCFSEIT